MNREDFYKWWMKLTFGQKSAVDFAIAERIHSDDFVDAPLNEIRQQVYNMFSEWH